MRDIEQESYKELKKVNDRWCQLRSLITSRVEELNTPDRRGGIIRPLLDRIRRNRADALILVLDDMRNLEEK